ncbi:hypothetical protein JHK85_053038 [Glycine max]|nr:hypothetical protein JHK86_052182 [Glycine max]KAG4926552.1 hypothetical protein JHK85_053038 [Glycine max]
MIFIVTSPGPEQTSVVSWRDFLPSYIDSILCLQGRASVDQRRCTNTTIVPSFTCVNTVLQLATTISILLQIWFTITTPLPPSSLEITIASNITMPTQINPTTKSSSFHSFSVFAKKVITHLCNSRTHLHPSHIPKFARSDSDPILRKQRSIIENHSSTANKCPSLGFS